jgi:hypothetical protein
LRQERRVVDRIDDPSTYNPFGWRVGELAEPGTSTERRRQLVEELMAWEAEELAHGYRHLTVEHGDPSVLEVSWLVSTLYDRLSVFAARTPWVRVRGTVHYVTVTVHGQMAEEAVSALTAIASELNPGDWTITESAYPVGIVVA